MSEWKKVGVIGVDAGLCWVGDPCYILHRDKRNSYKSIGNSWDDFCRKIDYHDGVTPFWYNESHEGLGIAVSTGYGDGEYDVLVKKNSEGRIAELKVVFIPEDEDECECEYCDGSC